MTPRNTRRSSLKRMMEHFTVTMTTEQWTRLRDEAARRGLSMAALARQAIDEMLREAESKGEAA